MVSYALFVRPGTEISSLSQAAGKRIIVQKSDLADDDLTRQKITPHLIRAVDPSRALELLASGQGDCALLPRLQGLYLAGKLGLTNIQAVGEPLLTRKYCIAVRQGDRQLLAVINEGLSILNNSGEYERIYARWFGMSHGRALAWKVFKYAAWVLVPVVVLLILVLAWSWSLKRTVRRRTLDMEKELDERTRTEQALRDSEEKYRLLVENATDAIYILQDRVFKFANHNAVELSGYSSDELGSMSFTQLLHPDDRPMVEARYQRRLAGEQVESNYPLRFLTKDGREVWLQINQVRITWQGRPATLNIARDVTRQRDMEARLRQSQKMEAVGTLAGGMAHDFNNILGAIIGYAELAQDSQAQGRECFRELERVIRSAERARDLVRQILTFSRKLESNLRPLQLNQEIQRTAEVLGRTLPKMVQIEMDLEPDLGWVNADATQMEQLIFNLAANAADAMPQGGRLTMRTRNLVPDDDYSGLPRDLRPGFWVQLTISDTGSGMDQETLDQIFDPFFTTKEPGKGTGLGLSSVFGIVKAHNGFIQCRSAPGEGTTFKVYLPVARPGPAVARKPPAAEALSADQERESILLVDDDEDLRTMGQATLAQYGYRVRPAVSGEQALELYRADPGAYDLVVLDLNMPGMGGLRCLGELRRLDPGVKVLVASGYASQATEAECRRAGAAGFIKKPYRRQEMLEAIRRVLDP